MKTNENERVKVVDIADAKLVQQRKTPPIFYRPRSIPRPFTASPQRDLWKTLVLMVGLVLICWLTLEAIH